MSANDSSENSREDAINKLRRTAKIRDAITRFDASMGQGNTQAAAGSLEEALRLLGENGVKNTDIEYAPLFQRMGDLAARYGHYEEALRQYRNGLTLLKSECANMELKEIARDPAECHMRQGLCLQSLKKRAPEEELISDEDGVGFYGGDDPETHFLLAKTLAERHFSANEKDDLIDHARYLSALAKYYYAVGKPREASRYRNLSKETQERADRLK